MTPSSTSEKSGGTEPFERVHLEDYWRVVRRRAWLILLTTGVALLGASWAAGRSPQLYRSSLTLQIGDPRGRTGQLGDIDVSPNLLWTDPVESELQQLTTQAVADFVVDTLQLRATTVGISRDRLLENMIVTPDATNGEYLVQVGERGVVMVEDESGHQLARGTVGLPLSFAGVDLVIQAGVEPEKYTLRIDPRRTAQSRVTGGLAASTRPETNLVDVTYTGADPLLTIRILNSVAAAVRALGVRRIKEWARTRTSFIENQLSDAGANLQGALKAIEHYKANRGLTSLSSEENRLLGRLSTLQSELEDLVIERKLYNKLIREISSGELGTEDVHQFAMLSGMAPSRGVQFYYDNLLKLLEERASLIGPSGMDPLHPEILALDRRIRQTEEYLLDAAGDASAALHSRAQALSQSLSELQRELKSLPGVETELARLQNQVEIHTEMYKYLLSRLQESQIAEAEISPYVDVLDPADWAWPVSGGRSVNVIFGGLIGLLLGVGAIFFLEYLDRSLRSTADVEAALGIPVLGWIPRIDNGAGTSIPLVAVQDPDGQAAEAYRVLRTNLAFSTAREERAISLVFTSPGPGEGKSTTAGNLATVLSARGDRTLLVDADLRRGSLHNAFDLLRSAGLTELLVGGLDPREAIRPDVRPNLDLLPAGRRTPNPSELLGSQSMAGLLQEWREQYRWVLLDAPPVLAVTDPAVLAALADATIVIVKAGDTDRRAAWRAVQQLSRVEARLIGTVLNEIQPSRSTDSYYLEYYYASQT